MTQKHTPEMMHVTPEAYKEMYRRFYLHNELLDELTELVEIVEQVAGHIVRKRDLNRARKVIAKAKVKA